MSLITRVGFFWRISASPSAPSLATVTAKPCCTSVRLSKVACIALSSTIRMSTPALGGVASGAITSPQLGSQQLSQGGGYLVHRQNILHCPQGNSLFWHTEDDAACLILGDRDARSLGYRLHPCC